MIYDNKLINESKSKVSSFIESQENLSLLRFITCGSVDDGKSTLIGRMLFEAQTLFEDQIQILKNDSKKHGTQGAEIDYALLLDGLSAEREQGITIDVAYRFFSTHKRKFIVADTPGHEQYTRNMITGASTADAAIILIDARKGLLEQTKRHSFLTSLVGIKNIIVAVNKMDLIDFNQETYNKIISDYKEFAENLNYSNIFDIPISALKGDNVIQSSKNLNWFKGPALLPLLETIKVDSTEESFILPIQNVIRPNLDYRAFCGKVSSGVINLGDKIKSLPSGESAKISSINIGKKNLKNAKYANDDTPLDPLVNCPASQKYSRSYLNHLINSKEILASTLLSWHNIAFYQDLTRKIRESVANNDFQNFYNKHFDILNS